MDYLNDFSLEETGNKEMENLTNGRSQLLKVEPESLEGVASAYRYKLCIKNECLIGATFNFGECLDVFSFTAVDKKRALKKEEWPTSGSLENPNRYDVKVQLMAGNVEIQTCDGCASWKEKTRKPFMVLTPTGERCVQYQKSPFLLLIFRCCPKFHSCNKQFRLLISISSPFTGQTFQSEVNIYRKKMISNKKRKVHPVVVDIPKTVPNNNIPFAGPSKTIMPRDTLDSMFSMFPYSKVFNAPHVVSPQLMYEMLYSSEGKEAKSHIVTDNCCNLPHNNTPKKQQTMLSPIKIEQQITQVPQNRGNKPKAQQSFWNFDAPPNPNQPYRTEPTTEEKWLDSVFSEINGGSNRTTLDDISTLLDLPENLPEVSLDHF